MAERWKDVVGYEGYYEISNRGCVWSVNNNKVRKIYTNRSGYQSICLVRDTIPHTTLIHHLVLDAFKRMRNDGEECNHKDGVKTNNRVGNLEWCTCSQNQRHSRDVLKSNVGKFARLSKHFIVIDPDGNEHAVHGLRQFCREENLNVNSMRKIANGKQKQHYGWGCRHD